MFSKIPIRNFASFKKVKVSGIVVDIDGDEMTKIIWKWIKDKVNTVHSNHYSTSSPTSTSRPSTTTCPLRTATKLMTKSQSTAPKPCSSTKSALSAPQSLPTETESRSSVLSRCGSPPTELSETSLTEQSSASQLLSATSPDLFPDGLSQLLSVDTPLETSTVLRTTSSPRLVKQSLFSPLMMAQSQLANLFTSLRAPSQKAAFLVCLTLTSLSDLLQDPALLIP